MSALYLDFILQSLLHPNPTIPPTSKTIPTFYSCFPLFIIKTCDLKHLEYEKGHVSKYYFGVISFCFIHDSM